ncbi:cation:proton antiporter [Lichenihabitans psoromatis]|uniref:cation:proton antiporter domain-containing protein n=1 Tax=Lichenihabitans psoromatis TaxID=2528642 RepID=UPI001A9533C0
MTSFSRSSYPRGFSKRPLQLKWPAIRRELPATPLLAFPGVFIAASAVALGVRFLLNWNWIGAALFGVLIPATDPISVSAAFKEMRVEERLKRSKASEPSPWRTGRREPRPCPTRSRRGSRRAQTSTPGR